MNLHMIRIKLAFSALMMACIALHPTPVTADAQAAVQTGAQNARTAEQMPAMVNSTGETDTLVCLDCHRAANINTNEGVIASRKFCLDCHQEPDTHKQIKDLTVSMVVKPDDFKKAQPIHQYVACIQCHSDVARSPHKTETGAQCLACHTHHGEGTANAPHLRVDCQACHFASEYVELDAAAFRVRLSRTDDEKNPVSLAGHDMADTTDDQACVKCHVRGNQVGAPAAVLPSKSVMCILCHAAPLSGGHPVFSLFGLMFIAGMMLMISFWYKGSVKGEEASLHKKIAISSESVWKTLFSRQAFSLIRIFILDIVLQKRILKESVSRWSMHSLIFTAILLRLGLSLLTSIGFYFSPESDWLLALMDKNHGFTAWVNDLLGLFILLGIAWAVVKRFVVKPDHVVSEYQDTLTLVLLGSLVLAGFLLEGARIHVTGVPADVASWSFAGTILSEACSILPVDWRSVYPVLWWIHGLIAVAFIAYIPFGKMKHMFNTPLTYFIEQVDGVKNEKRV